MSIVKGTKSAVGVRPPPWEARAERAARGERDPRWEFDADREAAARQARARSEPKPRAGQPEAPTEVRAGVGAQARGVGREEGGGAGEPAGASHGARGATAKAQGPGGVANQDAGRGAAPGVAREATAEDAGGVGLALAVAAAVRGGSAPARGGGGASGPAWAAVDGVAVGAGRARGARAAMKAVQAAPGARFAEVLEALEGRDVGPRQRTLRFTDTAAGALTVQVAVAGTDLLVRVRAHDPARRGAVARTLAQARRVLEDAGLVEGRVDVRQESGESDPVGEDGASRRNESTQWNEATERSGAEPPREGQR